MKFESKKIYMILKTYDENVRKVRSFDEMFGVLSKGGQEFSEYVEINTEEGLKTFLKIKEEVLGSSKTPVRIVEEEQLIYYVSPEETRGVIFTNETDAQNLFLNVEETYENVATAKVR